MAATGHPSRDLVGLNSNREGGKPVLITQQGSSQQLPIINLVSDLLDGLFGGY